MGRLFNMDIDEVSIVDLAANKKKFLLMKSKNGKAKLSKQEAFRTSEDLRDGHIHEVENIDANGNGKTKPASGPNSASHSHEVKEWLVADVIFDDYISRHPDKIFEKFAHPEEEEDDKMPKEEDEMPMEDEENLEEDEEKLKNEPAQILSNISEMINMLMTMMSEDEAPMMDEEEEMKLKQKSDNSDKKEEDKVSGDSNSSAGVAENSQEQASADNDEGKAEEELVLSKEEQKALVEAISELVAEIDRAV